MRKHLSTTLLSSVVIYMSLALSSFHSEAATARNSLVKLRSEGFASCKAIGDSGWSGVVRGETLDGSSRGGNRVFSLRACFSSKSECRKFINNVQHIVSNLDSVRFRKCTARG